MEKVIEIKDKILENAKEIIENQGLKGLTVQNIIDKCGIGKTTFYKHFPTKKALLLQLRHFGNNSNPRISSLKEQIAEIAREGFSKYGYNNYDMDSIAKAAKLNRVTLYRYFSNKDELLEYCIQGEFVRIKTTLSEHLQKFDNPEEALRQCFSFLDNFLKVSKDNSLVSETWNQTHRNSRIKELSRDLDSFFVNVFINILEKGKEKGIFRSDVNTSIFSGIIIMLQNGFMLTLTYMPEISSTGLIMDTLLNMILKEIKS